MSPRSGVYFCEFTRFSPRPLAFPPSPFLPSARFFPASGGFLFFFFPRKPSGPFCFPFVFSLSFFDLTTAIPFLGSRPSTEIIYWGVGWVGPSRYTRTSSWLLGLVAVKVKPKRVSRSSVHVPTVTMCECSLIFPTIDQCRH